VKKLHLFLFAILIFGAFILLAAGQGATQHQILSADSLQWQPGPLPGSKMEVLYGDPGVEGPFTIRIRAESALKIPPHWHPGDEHVTVLSGTFNLGLGETFDESKLTALHSGDYASMPAKERHFGSAEAGTVMQIDGMGPFKIMYVNPADDPAMKEKQ
jgi:quercetin dioxygenase-like cupin family protein